MVLTVVLVIVALLVGGYAVLSGRLPLITIAIALVVVNVWKNNMTTGEWWAFALAIVVGIALTWPKRWARVSRGRQWGAGLAVLAFTVLLVLPGSLFDGYGWAVMMAFIAIIILLAGWTVIGAIILVLALLVAVSTWGWKAFTAPIPKSTPSQGAATPQATPRSTPTPGPSNPTPSASSSNPTARPTSAPSGALVTTKAIVNWQQLKSAASADFVNVVDKSKPDQGNLAESKTWDSPATDARLVVVFASEAKISDKKARELAGAGSKTLVTRASGCYTPYDQQRVCPSGNQRVVLTIASTLKDKRGLGVVDDWGVAVVKVGNQFVYWPITYQ